MPGTGFQFVDAVDRAKIDRVDGEAIEGVGGERDDVAAIETVGHVANERGLGLVGMDTEGFCGQCDSCWWGPDPLCSCVKSSIDWS